MEILNRNGGEKMSSILFIAYCVLAYWAANQTIYANRIFLGVGSKIFLEKFVTSFLLGIILIPIAIIKHFLSK